MDLVAQVAHAQRQGSGLVEAIAERGGRWFSYAGFAANRELGDEWIGSSAENNIVRLRKSQIEPLLGFSCDWKKTSLAPCIRSAPPLVHTGHD